LSYILKKKIKVIFIFLLALGWENVYTIGSFGVGDIDNGMVISYFFKKKKKKGKGGAQKIMGLCWSTPIGLAIMFI
jgi:hypothetical protein